MHPGKKRWRRSERRRRRRRRRSKKRKRTMLTPRIITKLILARFAV